METVLPNDVELSYGNTLAHIHLALVIRAKTCLSVTRGIVLSG